jgi:predicted TIM-barrel fold metal-dependent hydrolase
MWEDLPEQYVPRRPRLATFSESGDMEAYTSGRLIEERVEPHILGPGCRMDDPLIKRKFSLLGEDQLLYSFDYPHGEARENAAQNLLERKDVTEMQKQMILYNNPVRFFGEP